MELLRSGVVLQSKRLGSLISNSVVVTGILGCCENSHLGASFLKPRTGLESLMFRNTESSELITAESLLHEQPVSSSGLQENRNTSGGLLGVKDYLHFFLQDKRFR